MTRYETRYKPIRILGWTVQLWLGQNVPASVRRGPKIERWANGYLIGFRRHFVIAIPGPPRDIVVMATSDGNPGLQFRAFAVVRARVELHEAIRACRRSGATLRSIADNTGLSHEQIRRICTEEQALKDWKQYAEKETAA